MYNQLIFLFYTVLFLPFLFVYVANILISRDIKETIKKMLSLKTKYKKGMKKIFKMMAVIIIILVALLIAFLCLETIKDYRPDSYTKISEDKTDETRELKDTISVLTWNIGYAGLNREMDFFYDGGKQVRPNKGQVEINLKAITDFLRQNKDVSFTFLQEIDISAKRSYEINEVEYIKQRLSQEGYFAMNYKVSYVPLPLSDPMGNVEAGLATFTSFRPQVAGRHSYPFNFGWPLRVFMLDRCFLEMRYPLNSGKSLVLINTHNSAFDENGELRIAELQFLRDFMQKEYDKGNYVIAGGDFNQCPVGLNPHFDGEVFDEREFISIPDSLFNQSENWQYVYDSKVPTNRRADEPYQKGRTRVTLIDFFIVSPNIEVLETKTYDLGFENSDHNPLIGRFRLK